MWGSFKLREMRVEVADRGLTEVWVKVARDLAASLFSRRAKGETELETVLSLIYQ